LHASLVALKQGTKQKEKEDEKVSHQAEVLEGGGEAESKRSMNASSQVSS